MFSPRPLDSKVYAQFNVVLHKQFLWSVSPPDPRCPCARCRPGWLVVGFSPSASRHPVSHRPAFSSSRPLIKEDNVGYVNMQRLCNC